MKLGNRAASVGPGARLRFGVGLFGLLLLVTMIWVGFKAPDTIPGRAYYTVKVQFHDADNITPHSAVRMSGRLIGQVLNPRIENGHGTLDLQLDPSVRPLRNDTRVLVRPRSLVGVRYLDLVPGLRGRPLADGEAIPAERTSAAVALDEVLATLDTRTRGHARELLQQLGGGVLGRGDDLNDTLADAAPMLRDMTTGLSGLNERPGATGRFVIGADRLAGAVEPVRDELAAGFEPARRAIRAFASNAPELRDTLEATPSALEAAQTQLPVVRPLVRELGRLGRAATPVLDELPVGLRAATRLLVESRPTLRRLPATLRHVDAVTPDTLTALDRLRASLPSIDDMTTTVKPIARTLVPRMCDVKAFAGHWANMNSYGDAVSNYLRFDLYGGDAESAFGATPQLNDALGKSTALKVLQNPYPGPCEAGREGGRNDPGADLPNDGLPRPEEGVALP